MQSPLTPQRTPISPTPTKQVRETIANYEARTNKLFLLMKCIFSMKAMSLGQINCPLKTTQLTYLVILEWGILSCHIKKHFTAQMLNC